MKGPRHIVGVSVNACTVPGAKREADKLLRVDVGQLSHPTLGND